jgi:dienelactone hydrolase
MRRSGKRVLVPVAILLIVAAAAGYSMYPMVVSAALLMDLSGAYPAVRRVLPVGIANVATRDLEIPARHGALAARAYMPEGGSDKTVLVVPGVHAGGVDEPRLDRLARRLAAAGAVVVTTPLPELRAYRITPASTDAIEDAALWLMSQRDLAPTGRIGLLGVSFSGGLAMVAAGRESIRDRLTTVISLGGHGDLPRTMRYLSTGLAHDGQSRRPHEYAVAVVLLAALPRLVPANQVAGLDRALVTYLDAAGATRWDPEKANRLLAEARRLGAALDEPAATIFRAIDARDVATIGNRLLPYLEEMGGHPALSPERSPLPIVPVFLVHGAADNVIHPSETTRLTAVLEREAITVHSLLTPLVTHADLDTSVTVPDVWRLVLIWTRLWEALAR